MSIKPAQMSLLLDDTEILHFIIMKAISVWITTGDPLASRLTWCRACSIGFEPFWSRKIMVGLEPVCCRRISSMEGFD
jgi:hypothetical protein